MNKVIVWGAGTIWQEPSGPDWMPRKKKKIPSRYRTQKIGTHRTKNGKGIVGQLWNKK